MTCALVLSTMLVPAFAEGVTLPGQRVELTAPTGEINVGDTVSIPVTINNASKLSGTQVKVTWDPTLLEADTTFKMGKYNCYAKPTDNSDGVNMFAAMFDLNTNDAAKGELTFSGAAGYEIDADYTTSLSLGTLKLKVLDAAAGKDVKVTVDAAKTYATTVKGNEVLDTPVSTSFKVAGGEEPPAPTKHTITFKNGDEVLKTYEVEDGKMPAYDGAIPTKAEDEDYTYEFEGWDPEVVAATADATYTAKFKAVAKGSGAVTLPGQRVELTAPTGEINVGDTVSIPVTINNASKLSGTQVKVTWDPTLLEADTTFKMGKYNCYAKPTDNSDGVNMFAAMFDLNTNDAAKGELTFSGAAGYEIDADYTTSLSLGTLKLKVLDAAAGKDVKVTVDAAKTYATTVKGNEVLDTPVSTSFKVAGGEEPPAPTKHTITFKNGDEVLKTYEVEDGKMPAYDGETPVKASTDEFDYTFKGWTPAIVAATADATYTAEFEATKKKYEITFNNYDGSKLTSTEVEYGTMPAYEGETPVKPEDDENTYKFIGWTPELANVTGAATYTAKFEAMPKAAETFKVTFKDDAGNVLHEEKFVKDTMPVYNGKKDADGNPAKDADTEFTYKFVKWDKEFAKVTADAEYVAEFEKTPIAKEFTITFKDEDGKVLYETKVPEGETPEYKGETPVKAEDENNVYEFEGWEPAIVAATADATYTAKFKATAKSSIVTITFKNGDAVLEEVKVEKGTKPEYKGEEPKKETEYAGTKVTTYKFAGWDPEIVQAEADATYTAKFEATESTRTLNSIKTDLTSLSIPNRTHKSGEEAVAAYVKDVVKVTAVYSEGPEEEVKSDDVTVTVVKSGSNATATVKYADKEATIALTYKAASSSRGNSVSGNTSKPSNPSTDDKKDEDKKDEDKKDEDKKDEDKKDEDTKPDDGNKPEDGNKPADGKFADVDDSHWAAKAAYELKAKGIISGDANNNANFDANITRQETAKLAILVNGIKAEAGDITATDAADVSDWAKDFMASAIKAGIMTGYEDGTVKPLNTITREEMVAIIIRALGVQVSDDAKLDFADKADITWSAPYVAAAVELGFVTGYEDNTFKAKQPITRAEAFVIFDRVLTFRDALTTAGAEK